MAKYKCADGQVRSAVRAEALLDEESLMILRKTAKARGVSFTDLMTDILYTGVEVELLRIGDGI